MLIEEQRSSFSSLWTASVSRLKRMSSSSARADLVREDTDHRNGHQRQRHRHERQLPSDVQFVFIAVRSP